MIKVKMMLNLEVDPEDYHVPSDGNLKEEIEDYVTDLIHEVDGIKILNIRTIVENNRYD
tara:strand:- start:8 stop:184 length:177 start_codon:yes stop_codon:yes gene_type:complete